jgi:hypothetical protein
VAVIVLLVVGLGLNVDNVVGLIGTRVPLPMSIGSMTGSCGVVKRASEPPGPRGSQCTTEVLVVSSVIRGRSRA